MRGICRECGEGFSGRSDKRFCSDACRNAYHNSRNRETNGLFRSVNRRLKQNYRILHAHLRGQTCGVIQRQELLAGGFDPNLFTGIARDAGGKPGHLVYDFRLVWRGDTCWVQRVQCGPGTPGGGALFPVLGIQLQGSHNDILPADLPDEQPILHNG